MTKTAQLNSAQRKSRAAASARFRDGVTKGRIDAEQSALRRSIERIPNWSGAIYKLAGTFMGNLDSAYAAPRFFVGQAALILMLRFGEKPDTGNLMRMIGQLENEASARLFSDFLYAQGIENQTEPERTGTWALWVHAEEQMDAAKALLNEYRDNPRDPKYRQASRVAAEKWKQEQKANEAAEKRFHDRSKLFPFGGLGLGYLTGILIVISVATALVSSFGGNTKPILWLYISEYDVVGGFMARLGGLPEIRHGEVWRLFTPIFVHFGPAHLFFNMLWMLDLGTMIERRQSSRMLLALVLVMGALSNFGQYLIGGPGFGGMSGVVYGLIGYIWLRGKFDLTSGLFLHSSTVMMAMLWFVLCLVHVVPNVANTAHSVGLGVGVAWGYISAMLATRR